MTPPTLAAPASRQTARISSPIARASPATGAAPRPGTARTRLLLEGPIARTLLRLAAPNVVVNVVLIAVTASVDAHFVGQLGSSALAGLSLVFPLMMLMQQMANSSMGGAMASAVARAIGSGRPEDASALVVHALAVAGVMAGVFTSVFLAAGPTIYGLMGGEGPALAAAIEYSNAIFAGALAYWLLSALTSVVRGTGQPTVLAIVYVAAEVLHVSLVPLLVFGAGPLPALGVTGAGVATVTSFAASSVFLAWYIASGRTPLTLSWRAITLERRFFTEILRVGAPMSLQPVLNNVSLATLTGFVGMSGPVALAAFGAAVRLEYVMYPLTFGLGAAVLAMVGTSLGAGQGERASRIAWTAAALGLAITAAVGLVGLLWPSLWISLFSASPEVHAMATSYMCIAGVAYPVIGLGLPLSSALQAAGRPLGPLLGIASRVLVVATGGWIVVHMTGTGLVGLGVVAALGIAVHGALLSLVCSGRGWRSNPNAKGSR